jgi:hypothetical protein
MHPAISIATVKSAAILRIFISLAANDGKQDQSCNDNHHTPGSELYEARKSFLLDVNIHFTVFVLIISHV